jgi:hypothetical protein
MVDADDAAPGAVTTPNHYGIVAAGLRELHMSQGLSSSVRLSFRKSWKSASAKRLRKPADGQTFALVN